MQEKMTLGYWKRADLIEMPCGRRWMGPRNRVLDGPEYLRHLVNTVERFTRVPGIAV